MSNPVHEITLRAPRARLDEVAAFYRCLGAAPSHSEQPAGLRFSYFNAFFGVETALLLSGDDDDDDEQQPQGPRHRLGDFIITVDDLDACLERLGALGYSAAHVAKPDMLSWWTVVDDPLGNRAKVQQLFSNEPDAYARRVERRAEEREASARNMRRLDQRPIPEHGDEVWAYMPVRNETLRLPFLLRYYRQLGVTRFFFVDNMSTDDTVKMLLDEPDTHVYQTDEQHILDPQWRDVIMQRHGTDAWWVIVDADEMLVYPHYEQLDLRALCAVLDEQGYDAVTSWLLEIYSQGPIRDAVYRAGDDPRDIASWFHPNAHSYRPWPGDFLHNVEAPARLPVGGVRKAFDIGPGLSKFPLVRYKPGMLVSRGTHLIEGARVAPMRAVTLHTKFLHDFAEHVARELAAGRRTWFNTMEYQRYSEHMAATPDLSLHTEESVQLDSSAQLVALEIIASMPALDSAKDAL